MKLQNDKSDNSPMPVYRWAVRMTKDKLIVLSCQPSLTKAKAIFLAFLRRFWFPE
jgi:hypothetical protein